MMRWVRPDTTFAEFPLDGGRRAFALGDIDSPRSHRPLVVFFHGFMTSPRSYGTVLRMVSQDAGVTVIAPEMYRRGLRALAGSPTVIEEAADAAAIVDELRDQLEPDELWLAGHSRGGQVAWLVAQRSAADGVIVIDPVDGVGRRPTTAHATAAAATFGGRTMVVGAGRGSRCAPAAMNHERFAESAPAGATHVVIPTMGHGDLLDDAAARTARRLCGGSDRPDLDRSTVASISAGFIVGSLPSPDEMATPFEVR